VRLDEGATLTAKQSRFLRSAAMRSASPMGALRVHHLACSTFVSDIGGDEGKRFHDAWRPVESAAGDAVDWFPDDQPVVLGTLEGAFAPARDAGLVLESSRALVRVVGEGDAP